MHRSDTNWTGAHGVSISSTTAWQGEEKKDHPGARCGGKELLSAESFFTLFLFYFPPSVRIFDGEKEGEKKHTERDRGRKTKHT